MSKSFKPSESNSESPIANGVTANILPAKSSEFLTTKSSESSTTKSSATSFTGTDAQVTPSHSRNGFLPTEFSTSTMNSEITKSDVLRVLSTSTIPSKMTSEVTTSLFKFETSSSKATMKSENTKSDVQSFSTSTITSPMTTEVTSSGFHFETTPSTVTMKSGNKKSDLPRVLTSTISSLITSPMTTEVTASESQLETGYEFETEGNQSEYTIPFEEKTTEISSYIEETTSLQQNEAVEFSSTENGLQTFGPVSTNRVSVVHSTTINLENAEIMETKPEFKSDIPKEVQIAIISISCFTVLLILSIITIILFKRWTKTSTNESFELSEITVNSIENPCFQD